MPSSSPPPAEQPVYASDTEAFSLKETPHPLVGCAGGGLEENSNETKKKDAAHHHPFMGLAPIVLEDDCGLSVRTAIWFDRVSTHELGRVQGGRRWYCQSSPAPW